MDENNESTACTLENGGTQERGTAPSGEAGYSRETKSADEKAERRKAWLRNLLTPP